MDELGRSSYLILFKVPAFNLFIITSWKHVGVPLADGKACKHKHIVTISTLNSQQHDDPIAIIASINDL